MPKFNARENDIVLYLPFLEQQTKKVCVDLNLWVSGLLALSSSDIIQILTCEAEEKSEDYDNSKNILLKWFQLSPEKICKKFIVH